ncbi:hypothetical protein BRADI_4g29075v3 [Brachypodium distachyon]|uniref:Uncharacterized protein n=1 Tax=Brachypodium distachyon TaxID=15368 RepID=A0A0Q3H9L5_BRADI|nr:hypothetical protein BRADI_4g29075v3 [Brachypodium distachyon]
MLAGCFGARSSSTHPLHARKGTGGRQASVGLLWLCASATWLAVRCWFGEQHCSVSIISHRGRKKEKLRASQMTMAPAAAIWRFLSPATKCCFHDFATHATMQLDVRRN